MLIGIHTMARGQTTGFEYYYWIDNDAATLQNGHSEIGHFQLSLNMTQLSIGMHALNLMVSDVNGRLSQPVVRYFYKEPTIANSKLLYWFDGDPKPHEATVLAEGVTEVDVSYLAEGVHAFRYQVLYGNGTLSQSKSHFFVKKTQPDNVITDYTYWLNDNNAEATDIRIENRQKTYNLNTMLALPSQPLRSSYFHFEAGTANPTIYPVNNLHMRFFDLYNNYTEVVCPYVDYAAGQSLTGVTWLQPNTQQTVDAPAGQTMRWFRFNAARGDSLQFCLDHAAKLQLFAPSGTEVMTIGSLTSTVWNDVVASESGTYYLTLHNVEKDTIATVNIDFRLVGKSLLGDVNGDGAVDIGDIVMVISVMTGAETTEAILVGADVNGDGTADIGDIVSIIDIMSNVQPSAARTAEAKKDILSVTTDRMEGTLSGNELIFSLTNSQAYTAFQLTVTLPEGTNLRDAVLNGERSRGHTVVIRQIGDRRYLVVGYSLSGHQLRGSDGKLLIFSTAGKQPAIVNIDDVVLATTEGQTVHLAGGEFHQEGVTAIADVSHKKEDVGGTLYDLQGRHVGNSQPKKGIYIIGNMKSVIK